MPPPPRRDRQPNRRPAPPPQRRERNDTSWENSAQWYDRLIGERGSELYQSVVLPGAIELLNPQRGEQVLDIGCGQGVFSRALATKGCQVTGIDAAATLVKKAKEYPSRTPVKYLHRDAAALHGLGPFDAISAILCIQNMQHLPKVCAAAAEALKSGGRMLWVMNHPAFRIPRQTSWGFEEERKIQYRRIDAYSSPMTIPIVMHPGQKDSESTVSFHHSLTDLMAPAFNAGLMLGGLQEWHSHKASQPGPRAKAENRARNEFPLFLALLWRKA